MLAGGLHSFKGQADAKRRFWHRTFDHLSLTSLELSGASVSLKPPLQKLSLRMPYRPQSSTYLYIVSLLFLLCVLYFYPLVNFPASKETGSVTMLETIYITRHGVSLGLCFFFFCFFSDRRE